MLRGGMMLCKAISKICGAWSSVDMELFLINMILDPVESHVHGLGFLLFYLFVGKAVA
jgi:hypothetical protein